jgi:hypothetical protein
VESSPPARTARPIRGAKEGGTGLGRSRQASCAGRARVPSSSHFLGRDSAGWPQDNFVNFTTLGPFSMMGLTLYGGRSKELMGM